MVSQDNIDAQHSSKEYRIIMGIIAFVGVLIVRYALAHVAGRLTRIRSHLGDWIGKLLLVLFILGVIFLGLILLLNIYGRHQAITKHTPEEKDI